MGRVIAWIVAMMLGGATVAAAQQGYSIRPGDVLQVEVLEDSSLNRSVLVLPDGSFSFPLAGTVQASGRTVDQVRQTLSGALEPNFAVEPSVVVSVAQLGERPLPRAVEPIEVFIMGEVAAPGRKAVPPGTTLLQFLAEAGGLSRFAADKRIELRRVDRDSNTERAYLYNHRTRGGPGSISAATVLAPGDVVIVPERRLFE